MTDNDHDFAGMPTNPAPAAVIPVAVGIPPGRVLAYRYEILAKLGHGGMGAVFRAHDRELGEDVALKVILPERIRDPGVLDRFRREVKLARKIAHPNVCRVFDMGEEGSLRFLTMEFVDGKSLREILATGPLEPTRALSILHQIIQGVAAAHAQGIVHRDLKPDNVMIRDGGQAVVADFGLARIPTGDVAESNFAGTPAYMSPEQLRGESLDGRSDIFALGIVAYEMLTGRLPFTGDSIGGIAAATLRDPPASFEIPTLSESMQRGIKAAIFRALEKKPADRFASCSQFGEALVSAGVEHSAPTMTNSAPFVQVPERRTAKVAAIGVVAALALGILIWRPWSTVSGAQQEPAAAVSASGGIPSVPKNEHAETLYRQAKLAMHDGDVEKAIATMKRATAINNDYGAAELRLAIWMLAVDLNHARSHYLAAVRLRETLDAHDNAVLHAMGPWLKEPPDVAACEAEIATLVEKHPQDVEALLLLAGVRSFRLRLDAAVEATTRAVEIDPTNVIAWTMKADALSLLGDTKGQLEAYEACLSAVPTAASCLRDRIHVRAQIGECMLMKEDAKNLLTLEPNAAATHRLLAAALESTGEGRESVVHALEKSYSLQSGSERTHSELDTQVALVVLDGNFESAVRLLEQRRSRVAADTDQHAHAVPANQLAFVYIETGLPRKADEIALSFLRRKEAWIEDFDNDVSMKFFAVRLRAGSVSAEEFKKRRTEWMDRFRKKWLRAGRTENDDLEWLIWSLAYGLPTDTRQDAVEALEKMPRTKGPAVLTGRLGTDYFEGKVYALGGEFDKAIEPLKRAADTCNVLSDPMTPTWARFYLGMALQGTGDEVGARHAFQHVIDRWGKAKPRSITAERAKEALKKLGVSDKPNQHASTKPSNPFGTAIDTRR